MPGAYPSGPWAKAGYALHKLPALFYVVSLGLKIGEKNENKSMDFTQ